jgi:2-hydroxy-6-oxonona-2,4-dienedioate hydrolase
MRLILVFVAGLAVGATCVLWFFFDREIDELQSRVAGGSKTIPTAWGAMEYAEIGQGPPVLVIHGSGGGFDQGLEMAGPLAKSGFRLIAPSRFGYLGSDVPDYASPEGQADAFAALLDHLGLQTVAVIGASAGALSAMQFAIRYPNRCSELVLFVPATFSPARKPNTAPVEGPMAGPLLRTLLGSDFVFWLGVTLAPDTMTRTLLATEPKVIQKAGSEEQQRVKQILRHILPVSRRTKGLLLDMQTAGAPPRYELERIACPVIAVSANDDLYGTAASAKYTAAQVPNGRLILYQTGGHLLVGKQHVWRDIASFLTVSSSMPSRSVSPTRTNR